MNFSTEFLQDQVKLNFPDGSNKIFKKISRGELSALDYLYENKIDEAKKIYFKIRNEKPDFIELKDHQMSFLASVVYFDLIKNSVIPAKEVAKNILNLGIERGFVGG